MDGSERCPVNERDDKALMTTGRGHLVPSGSVNPLVGRGLASLLGIGVRGASALAPAPEASMVHGSPQREPPRFFARLHLHCEHCGWSVTNNFLEIGDCPKCGKSVARDRSLHFGGLAVSYHARKNKFFLTCPQDRSTVEVAEADVPDTIHFLARSFRGDHGGLGGLHGKWLTNVAAGLSGKPYVLGWLHLHCDRCGWNDCGCRDEVFGHRNDCRYGNSDGGTEVETCPNCAGSVAANRVLRFGGLAIECVSGGCQFLFKSLWGPKGAGPQVWIDDADVPETLVFLDRYFRHWT